MCDFQVAVARLLGSRTPRRPRAPLSAWYAVVKQADWTKWADVKAVYRNADQVGDCVVFNVGGNNYRLIARIRYSTHKLYILKVMTHKQYDRGQWAEECGCHRQPPARKKQGT